MCVCVCVCVCVCACVCVHVIARIKIEQGKHIHMKEELDAERARRTVNQSSSGLQQTRPTPSY